MPEKKNKTGLWIIGCLVVFVLLICCACASIFGLFMVAPGAILMQFVSNQPAITSSGTWDEIQLATLQAKIEESFAFQTNLVLTGEEITELVLMSEDSDLKGFSFSVTPDNKANVLLSVEIPSETGEGASQYLNLDLVGDIEIQDGKFTKLVIDKLKVGNFDIGMFLKGQDMAQNIQESFEQEGENPIEGIDYLAINNGMVEIKVNEAFLQSGMDDYDYDYDYDADYDYDLDYDYNYNY